jgi:hypothetical protein
MALVFPPAISLAELVAAAAAATGAAVLGWRAAQQSAEAMVSQDTFLTACCITCLNLRLRYARSAVGGAKHGNSCPPHNFGSAPNMDKLALDLGITREQLLLAICETVPELVFII